MNKIKFEIIRINEDIIATSGVCKHQDSYHILITGFEDPKFIATKYFVDKKNYVSSTPIEPNDLPSGTQVSDTKFYYYDGSSYKLCEGSHDFSSFTDAMN